MRIRIVLLLPIVCGVLSAAVTNNGSSVSDPYEITGAVAAGTVVANSSSEVKLLGGSASNVTLNDSSVFDSTSGSVSFQTTYNNMASGSLLGGSFFNVAANGSANLTVGGSIVVNNDLAGQGSSTVTISGGTPGLFVFANDSATMNITGGSLGSSMVFYNNSSTGMISGGDDFDTLSLGNDAMVTMLGNGFTLDGVPVSGTLSSTSGNLMGTLQNGDTIDLSFDAFGSSSLLLVPEPGVFSLILLGAVPFLRRRR